MIRVHVCEDIQECARIWNQVWPQQCLFDLWPVRDCFAGSYRRHPYFLVAEEGGMIQGLLALSWIGEGQYYAHFPGETWNGKTWLEQNRILASSSEVLNALLDNVPGPTELRYLTRDSVPLAQRPIGVDEVGYLFFPGEHAYSFEKYMQLFSGKSRKKLGREMARLADHGVSWRCDHVADIQWLFRTNLESFGESSYFYNPSFLDSFEKLAIWLHRQGMLRITTALLGGTIAAVDIGALQGKSYTVLAGGTNQEFPGVAKMINFHHLERACRERMDTVDFLCGDFGWKQRFHLTPRPLYEMNVLPDAVLEQEADFYQVHAREQ